MKILTVKKKSGEQSAKEEMAGPSAPTASQDEDEWTEQGNVPDKATGTAEAEEGGIAPSAPTEKPAASSTISLKLGKEVQYTLYTGDGTQFLQAGEIFNIEKKNCLRTWIKAKGELQLFGLDEGEVEAYNWYSFDKSGKSAGDQSADSMRLDERPLSQDEILSRGVYLCGDSTIYINEDTPPLTPEDVNTLFALWEEEEYYMGYYDRNGGRISLTPIYNDLIAAIVNYAVFKGEAIRSVEPGTKEPVALEAIDSDASLKEHVSAPLTRLRTNEEKKQVEGFFDQAMNNLDSTLNTVGKKTTKLGTTTMREHQGLVKDTIAQVLTDGNLVTNLLHESDSSNYLINHSFKAAILCVELATKMDLSKGDTMDLGLSAVIQDIGMNYISSDVLNKTTPLTPGEMDKIYQHPLYSRDIIEKSNTVPSHIADIAMQGHERINGSGYPRGLQGDHIDHMGKVLAVASVYTALISPRPYRPALDPYRAMITLLHYSQHRLLDREIIRKLVETLSLFPVGSLVRLKSGAIGKVVSANDQAYTQPTVRILLDAQGQMLERPRLVNLEKDEEKIVRAVEAEKYPELGGMVGF